MERTEKPFDLVESLQERSIRFAEYLRSAVLISQHRSIRRCRAVYELVDADWYEDVHIPKEANMLLLRKKELGEGVLGMVVRRNIRWKDETRGLFLIQVANIRNVFEERFVIAHELGHVLAHGRLMYPGMIIAEALWEHSEEEADLRRLVELEANIYALLSSVPSRAIEALRDVLQCEVRPPALRHAMWWLSGGHDFGYQLAEERLLLDRAIAGKVTEEDFARVVFNKVRSWTFQGPSTMALTRPSTAVKPDPAISKEQFYRWVKALVERKILRPEHWKGTRQFVDALDAFGATLKPKAARRLHRDASLWSAAT